MVVISYHINKSTGVGGIENFIRSIQNIAVSKEYKTAEIYHGICGDEVSSDNSLVSYYKLRETMFSLDSKINNNLRKVELYSSIKNCLQGKESIVFLFNPFDLLFIPNSVLKRSKVIIVQANKVDSIFRTKRARLALFLKEKYIDLITVYTSNDQIALLRYYPNLSNKVRVIPRGCKLVTGQFVVKDCKKLVTIARIQETQKNFDSMLDIMKTLPEGYSLDIYGAGDIDEVETLKLKIKKHNNVSFKGFASDVKNVLHDYSVFLMTSHYEGFGQTLIEARSQGLPIVAFETFEALSWIVDNGISGEIVESYNNDEFKQAILKITNDDVVYQSYSEASLIKAQDTEMSRINDMWMGILNEY
ncbi:glycosyltransferase [Vibrio sp. ECSMB14106]|uniref:glycosyltransferase n=1 Tax=Vibrio sp. ECSMB14106 TaxID=1638949 RepID=UPI0006195B8F|nr:glycosyltransferase [Vibrio sp. ECSMB14106]